jgi:glutaconate CoA-transferase subunit B
MRLTTYHPWVTVEQIQAHTGFPLEVSPAVMETTLPTLEEIDLLRKEIDPMNIRRLEMLGGSARRELLHKIIDAEKHSSQSYK